MGRTSQLPDNLPQLQNLIKRDPESYRAEFEQQYRRYESNLQVFLLQPSEDAKSLSELTMFIGQVAHCYPDVVGEFPEQLREILKRHASALHPEIRMMFCRALMLLRNKKLISPASLFELFFELFRCSDKLLRKTLYNFIIQDIKNLNIGHKDNKLNKTLQNFMYTMLSDSNSMAAKMSLNAMAELYNRKVWNDAKTVNVISTACFSKFTKVLSASLRFFLGQDKQVADSDSEAEEEGPSARDIILRFATKKKSTRAKAKRDKALKVLNKHKRKMKKQNTDFSAIHLLHDPQGFVERLFKQLQKTNESFEIRLLYIVVISRIVGVHQLFLFNFYPFIQRFLQPHQRDVTKLLLAVAQASHELVPPEIIRTIIMTIANNFVSERNSSEVMGVGLNAVREICARCPLAMTEDLLRDLTQYKTRHDKAVTSAARSLIQLYRRINPTMLFKKDRGKPTEASTELQTTEYGKLVVKDYIPGAEALPETPEVDEDNTVQDGWESCSNASDNDGSWKNVSSDEEEIQPAAEDETAGMDPEEKIQKAQIVSQMRLLTQEEFQRVRAQQASKEVLPAARKRKVVSLDSKEESAELVALNDIELVHKKRPHDRESRLATVLRGREDREKFGRKKAKMDPFASTTNKEKRKKKPFMMVREKMKKKKSGRSFREKQMALRAALVKRAKRYK
uniref:protein SDA1 homolog n=1 Tax=Ciona intestinalis TaxID=7719 RepID=UPI000180B405|nr:protein SDA1 homolog [Ciona intestinalis]|eukprot:XP_002127211.1 protein SDA1 homolog [Ciona intestinalis]